MICSKIQRTLIKDQLTSQEQEIVTGMGDYIPNSLKVLTNINISLIGDQQQIINQILWNQFFSKSLLKESYYFLMHNYSTQGKQTMSAVFVKKDGKVYKMQDIMDWKSPLRENMRKENNEVTTLQIEAFSNKGNIKKINIFISNYPICIDKLHLILKTNTIEVATISKNKIKSQITDQFRFLQETDTLNKKNTNSVSQHGFNTNKTKNSQVSMNSIKTKQSNSSKQNCKRQPKSRLSTKRSKKSNKDSYKESILSTKRCLETNKKIPQKSIQDISRSIKYERPSISRQTVLSKIISSKQEQIILLKEQLQQKADEFEVIIKDQQQFHQKQVAELTKKVKNVLQSYSQSQKQAANQNVYLKQRVKILQETVEKTNDKLDNYTNQMQGYLKNIRQLQEMNKRLSETNKQLAQQQQKGRNTYISQQVRMNNEIVCWKEKAEDYKIKYEKIVDMMKNVINFT